ncbi:hypothetical protein SCUP515_06822 [Seiridium cupressi]
MAHIYTSYCEPPMQLLDFLRTPIVKPQWTAPDSGKRFETPVERDESWLSIHPDHRNNARRWKDFNFPLLRIVLKRFLDHQICLYHVQLDSAWLRSDDYDSPSLTPTVNPELVLIDHVNIALRDSATQAGVWRRLLLEPGRASKPVTIAPHSSICGDTMGSQQKGYPPDPIGNGFVGTLYNSPLQRHVYNARRKPTAVEHMEGTRRKRDQDTRTRLAEAEKQRPPARCAIGKYSGDACLAFRKAELTINFIIPKTAEHAVFQS